MSVHFPFASNCNRFLGVPLFDAQPFVVCGVPFDGSVTNRPGARFGPQAIRHASLMLCDGIHPHFNTSIHPCLGDAGDMHLAQASGVVAARAHIQAQALPLFQKHHPVFLGGDHSITLALLRAAKAQFGALALVHFDAHCDTWHDHFGEPSGHGTWLYEALHEGLVNPVKTVQIGLRSSGTRAVREYVREQGGMIYTAASLRGKDGAGLDGVIASVTECVGSTPCYLTLDIDCLDPAFAPGTGTPEPGGLFSTQVLTLLEGLAPLPWIGMDCVEVAPAYDHAELTSNMAAHLVWTYLAGQCQKQAQQQAQ